MGDVFLALLNMSITAGWLILAVLCVRFIFRKIPKWVNCVLWGVVAIRLIFPFSIESELSLQPSAEPIQSSTMVEGKILPYVPSVDSNFSIVENTVNPILTETFAYQESDSVAPLQVITGIACMVWLCGMIILLVFAIGSMIRLYLLIRESVHYKDNIYICDVVKSPFILGMIRPRIYLSSALSEDETDYIIAHEKAHLVRKDHLWKPFGYLLLCVYWFNPLCWIAYIMLCKDIELACDEKVIKNMSLDVRKEYSRVLLSCAMQRRLVMVCPLAFGEVGVKERVKSVLNYKKPAFWITIAAIVGCVIIAICFLTNPSREYQVRISIPAGSTADFCYSDEEISPKGDTLTIACGDGLGDTEVVLLPIEASGENAYEPTYITPGMPVKLDVEKGAWYKIGVSNMQSSTGEDMDVYVSVHDVEIRIASEENTKSENNIYGNVIAGLGDNDTYAFLTMGYDYMVLLTSDLIYDEGTEKQASIYCDVYYPVDGEAKKLGTIMSDGTAYPITFTKDGIFAAAGHKIEKYAISEEGTLYLEKGVYEQFDEAGNVQYASIIGEQERESTEQEYLEMVTEYGGSQIVHFSYGAENSVNEFHEMKDDLGIQKPDTEDDHMMLYEQPKADKVCIKVQPSMVSGQLSYFYIPTGEAQNWLQQQVEALDIKWEESNRQWEGHKETGWHIVYNDIDFIVFEGRYLYCTNYDEEKGVQECLIEASKLCDYIQTMLTDELGYVQYDVADIKNIVSATLEVDSIFTGGLYYSQTITDQNTLKKFEEWFCNADYLYGGVDCGNQCALLTLTMSSGDVVKLSMATDSCPNFIINGVAYDYMPSSDFENREFFECFDDIPWDWLSEGDAYGKLEENDTKAGSWDNAKENPLVLTTEFTEPVNTLADVKMLMEKYKSTEGDLEIVNHSGKELQTGEQFDIQMEVDGKWYRIEQLYDAAWKDLAYGIPDGETTVIPTQWSFMYGKLPAGSYRIVKKVMDYRAPGDYDTYYLAAEFKMKESH